MTAESQMDPLLKKPPSTELVRPLEVDATLLDYYRIFRGQIEHEDNLVGSRISWFVTSQSFLFSAYAIIASGIQPNAAKVSLDAKHILLLMIPAIAVAASVLILLAILSGLKAMRTLRSRYHRFAARHDDSLLPPIQGDRSTRLTGMAAPTLLPLLFMAVWIYLLLRRLF